MAAPTFPSYVETTDWFSSLSPRVLPSLTWQTDDRVLVIGLTSDSATTLNTPTVAGLTFTLVAGPNNIGTNKGLVYLWQAVAASSSSGTISVTSTGTAGWGAGAIIARGSTGLGAAAVATPGTAYGQSLTRTAANSGVLYLASDWGATSLTGAAYTPTGQTVRTGISNGSDYAAYVLTWGDQGAASTATYGRTGSSGSNVNRIAVEVFGDTAGSTATTFSTAHLSSTAADSGVTVGTDTKRKALTATPAGTVTGANVNTTASGTALQHTDSAAAGTNGTALSWYTDQLEAVTISGALTYEVSGRESATTVNAGPGLRVERCSSDGTVLSTIVDYTTTNATIATEWATTASPGVRRTSSSITPTSTTLAAGDRLRITLWARAVGGTMAAGNAQVFYNGTSGSAGSSSVTFAETLTVYTPPSILLLGDRPGASRPAGPATTLALGLNLTDRPAATRTGQPPAVASFGLALTDRPTGVRTAGPPQSLTTSAAPPHNIADSPGAGRAGTPPSSLTFGLTLTDRAGASRSGTPPQTLSTPAPVTVDVSWLSLTIAATPALNLIDRPVAGRAAGAPQSLSTGALPGLTLTDQPFAAFARTPPQTFAVPSSVFVDVSWLSLTVAAVAPGLTLTDTPGAGRIRSVAQSLATPAAASLTLTDRPSGVRAARTSQTLTTSSSVFIDVSWLSLTVARVLELGDRPAGARGGTPAATFDRGSVPLPLTDRPTPSRAGLPLEVLETTTVLATAGPTAGRSGNPSQTLQLAGSLSTLADRPGVSRAGRPGQTLALDLALTDRPTAARLAARAEQLALGLLLRDRPSATRAASGGQSLQTPIPAVNNPWDRVARTSTPVPVLIGTSAAVPVLLGASTPVAAAVGSSTATAVLVGASTPVAQPGGTSTSIPTAVGTSTAGAVPAGTSTPLTTNPEA